MNNSYVLDDNGVKQPLYEPDRYSDEYIKAYAVWNNRKKAKQKLCQDIKKRWTEETLIAEILQLSLKYFIIIVLERLGISSLKW